MNILVLTLIGLALASGSAQAQSQGPVSSTTGTTPEKTLAELVADSDARVVAAPRGLVRSERLAALKAATLTCSADGNSQKNARDAIAQAVTDYADPIEPGAKQTPIFVHIVTFEDGNNVARNCWFTVEGGRVSTSKRLFGVDRFRVLFLHLDWQFTEPGNATEKSDEKNFDPATRDIRYYAIVKRKLPQNVRNLLALLRLSTLAASAQAGRKKPVEVSYYGFGYETGVPRTSDITFLPVEHSGTELLLRGAKLMIDNEGRHWWDVSVGVPVTKLTGLEFSETTSRFDPKEVNKQTLYGMVNLFAPADLKGTLKWYNYPRILLGTGVTGRPGERFFLGAGVGIKELQFFAGSGFALFDVPVGTEGDQRTEKRYRSRFTMGVNIPVLSAIEALTK